MPPTASGSGSLLAPEQEPGDHLALALDGDRSPSLEAVAVAQAPVGAVGYLDAAGGPLGLHAAGGVDGVTPQVVDEPLRADDAGHHGAGVDADADRQWLAGGVGAAGHLRTDRQRHV